MGEEEDEEGSGEKLHFCEVEGKALRQEEEQRLAEAQKAAQGRPAEGWTQGGRERGREGRPGHDCRVMGPKLILGFCYNLYCCPLLRNKT